MGTPSLRTGMHQLEVVFHVDWHLFFIFYFFYFDQLEVGFRVDWHLFSSFAFS